MEKLFEKAVIKEGFISKKKKKKAQKLVKNGIKKYTGDWMYNSPNRPPDTQWTWENHINLADCYRNANQKHSEVSHHKGQNGYH